MRTVLALICHPDDMEFFCSGTLLACKSMGDRVVVCNLCNGDLGSMEIPPEEEEELPPPVEEELPPPPVFEVNVAEDTIEIPEEPVPLADAPKTGSDAIIWIALAIFAALGMAATRFTNKKRQHETF